MRLLQQLWQALLVFSGRALSRFGIIYAVNFLTSNRPVHSRICGDGNFHAYDGSRKTSRQNPGNEPNPTWSTSIWRASLGALALAAFEMHIILAVDVLTCGPSYRSPHLHFDSTTRESGGRAKKAKGLGSGLICRKDCVTCGGGRAFGTYS